MCFVYEHHTEKGHKDQIFLSLSLSLSNFPLVTLSKTVRGMNNALGYYATTAETPTRKPSSHSTIEMGKKRMFKGKGKPKPLLSCQ